MTGLDALAVTAQVTIADIVTILSVPIVLEPGRTLHALLGGALVAVGVLVLLAIARLLRGRAWVGGTRTAPLKATPLGTRSAPFAAGPVPARMGCSKERHERPGRRLRRRAHGRADRRTQTTLHTGAGRRRGFFIPLYFVVLGAQLDLHGLFENLSMLALAAALVLLNIAIHLAAVLITRRPLSAGLAASAQLGVPAAVASLGLAEHVLSGTVATAIVAAAVVSLGVCTFGVERMLAHESQIMPAAS